MHHVVSTMLGLESLTVLRWGHNLMYKSSTPPQEIAVLERDIDSVRVK